MSALQQIKQWAWRLYHVDENSKPTDIALLVIRAMVAVCLIYHHGAEKFYDFNKLVSFHLDPIGIGVVPSIMYAGFADGICALLVLLGLFSRYAAIGVLICLNTVFWFMEHGLQRLLGLPIPIVLAGPAPPVPPPTHTITHALDVPMYILGFLVVLIAGPGRYSLDKKLEARMHKKTTAAAITVAN